MRMFLLFMAAFFLGSLSGLWSSYDTIAAKLVAPCEANLPRNKHCGLFAEPIKDERSQPEQGGE